MKFEAISTTSNEVTFRDLLLEPLRNGVYKQKRFHGRGVKVVNMKELFAYDRIGDQPDARIDLSTKELLRFSLRDGDLLFARRSFVLEGSGKCSLIEGLVDETVFESSMIRARVNSNSADPRFLYYYFRAPQGRALMATIASRTAVSGITGTNLASLRLRLPSIETQQRIGDFLASLDHLIENNLRRVEVLEEMARAVYREWFVHFHFPGHENAALVGTTLPIPEGWAVGSLSDLADEIREGVRPSDETASIPYVPIDEIDRRSLTLKRWRPGSEAASSLRLFDAGDVLFGAMRAYFHKVSVAPFQGVTRSTCFVLRPKTDWYYHFTVMTLSEDETVAFAARHSSGSTIPYAKWANVLSEMPVVLPTPALAEKFGVIIDPILCEARTLATQSNQLAAIRDILLPKVVTGQIDVSGLETLVEDGVA